MLVWFWELLMGSESFNGSHYALLYFDQSFKALKKRKASAQVLNYCSHSDIVSRGLAELLLQPYHHYIWDLQLLSDRRHKGYEGLILEHRVTHCLHLSLSLFLIPLLLYLSWTMHTPSIWLYYSGSWICKARLKWDASILCHISLPALRAGELNLGISVHIRLCHKLNFLIKHLQRLLF